ncbi:hypothetical protein L6164_020947 [Bauhinia variegata]|uniref:Uncharacterized protein n=1 Tax=Bauhinia variegata TaxID=167791 RepID=A0ACB9MYQ0_BAUVA|nr:hypothetical protein L6164_020947 [Bauhinia variegata]
METIISSSSVSLFNRPLIPVRTVTSTSTSQSASLSFLHCSTKLTYALPRVPSTLGFRKHSSTIPKFAVTCGAAITEINESQFPDTVLKSNRPVLVEFVANWCGPCRLISPVMESIAQEYGDRLTVVKIDHDANPRLIEEYKVYGLPALILFKNGQEVPESRREGAITKVKLREYLDALLEISVP